MHPIHYEIDSKNQWTSRNALVALALAESEQRQKNLLDVLDRIQRASDSGEVPKDTADDQMKSWAFMFANISFDEGKTSWASAPVACESPKKVIHPAEKSVYAAITLANKYRKERDDAKAEVDRLKAEVSRLKKPPEETQEGTVK